MFPDIRSSTQMNLQALSVELFLRIMTLSRFIWTAFLTTAKLEGLDISGTLEQLEEIGEKFGISFIISVSLDKEEIPAEFQDKIATAL